LLDDVGGGDHEDDQQHQRDVHQRRHVDAVDSLVFVAVGAARHQLPLLRCTWRPAAMALPSAFERPITRLSNRWKMLNASTAGMATKSPTAVATRASEIPVITEAVLVPPPLLFAAARSTKARMMPSTVPNRPMKGALFPRVPSTN